MKKSFNLHKLLPCIAFAVLLSLPLIFSIPNVKAKFTSQDSGGDSARVAKFAIYASSLGSNSLSIDSTIGQTSAEYKFSVSDFNGAAISEVSQEYAIIMTLPAALPGGVSIGIEKNNSSVLSYTKSADGKIYTFSKAGAFAAGVKATDEFTLKFTVDSSVAEDILITGIKIEIQAEQID